MSAPICSAKSKNSWVPKALLSLTYKAPEDRWYVQGFVQNIENEITLVDVRIADAAARESDLLAFQLGIEIGNRGAVMCPANRTDGTSRPGAGAAKLNRLPARGCSASSLSLKPLRAVVA